MHGSGHTSGIREAMNNAGALQYVDFLGNPQCIVWPGGKVDMTLEGGSVISANSPKSKSISVPEKRLL